MSLEQKKRDKKKRSHASHLFVTLLYFLFDRTHTPMFARRSRIFPFMTTRTNHSCDIDVSDDPDLVILILAST